MHCKHAHKEDEKHLLLHRIDPFPLDYYKLCVTDKKRRQKMYFSKVNIHHDKFTKRSKKTNKKVLSDANQNTDKYTHDMEAERKTRPENTVIQMKERKRADS